MDTISFYKKDFSSIFDVILYVESIFECEIISVSKDSKFFNVELVMEGLK